MLTYYDKANLTIYSHVLNHLNEIISISENSDELKNNIKLVTYNYLINNEIVIEEIDSNLLDTVKAVFWSTTLPAWTGKISLSNWISGILVSGVSGKFSFFTSILSQVVSKLTNVTYKGTSATALAATNVQILRTVSILIFPTVLVGLLLYRLIKYNDIKLIKNFELSLKSVIDTLRLTNNSELSILFQSLNTKYDSILLNDCSKIEDQKSRLTCASHYYVKFITEDILTKVIKEYILYSKKNNIDLSYILTYYDLSTMKIGVNPILMRRMSLLYELYVKMLNSYVFESSLRTRYVNLLNDITIKTINEAYHNE